jgi:GNAT superfamily N-acetyltransferase
VADELALRRYRVEDEPAVLELLGASLGWVPDDLTTAFFRWKHLENPFGESAAWVAERDGRLAGFRTFLRWEWDVPGEGVVRAVRAVDTATHPDFQGQGIFSALTLHAVDELTTEGVGFVFNTPNDQSRPGYLKMGWRLVRRLPIWTRPRSLWSATKLLGAAVAADKWSLPTRHGLDASDVLDDEAAVTRLLEAVPARGGASTHRTPAVLRWRYGFPALHYRAALAGPRIDDGVVIYRLRRRGPAVEAAVCDLLVPGDDARTAGRLLRSVATTPDADFSIRLAGHGPRKGWLPVPGQGPTFVWREVTRPEPPPSWDLVLGDVELF